MDTLSFHPSLLREYDIRGIVDKTLFDKDAYWIGRCFGHIIRETNGKSVAVCRDGRLSSPQLHKALIQGLCESGTDVYDLGVGPTPMLYFSEYILPVDGAIMITGSHNPPTHNGFKLSHQKKPFFGESIQTFSQFSPQQLSSGQGKVFSHQISSMYVSRLLEDLTFGKELTVAWDSGHGATSEIVKSLVQKLPGKHILLNVEIDGTFPAHPPDPSNPENLVQLQELVSQNKCHLGLAFDGDGDRLIAIDGKGRILWGDQLLLLFANDLLKRNSKATIIADIKASQGLFDEIKRQGGNGLMWKTGHSHIKTKMSDSQALLGGEMSGHLFFKENYYGFDDGIYAALQLLSLLSLSSQSLEELYDDLPHFHGTPEIRIPCPSELKFNIPQLIKANLKAEGHSFVDIDGIRVQLEEGWWLLRASHTEDVLVARCESSTKDGLEILTKHLRNELKNHQIFLE
ncbi:MAG: phosphomannomutase/phosphoglucomutase [Alphaproteobacteria bacterium]|nr:phosphomannomutase/phosphoglucomutase [Alphaproteobacteria bacterium]